MSPAEPASKLTERLRAWPDIDGTELQALHREAASALEQAGKTLALLLDQPAVRALDRDAYGVRSNIGPYQLARDALAALVGQDKPWDADKRYEEMDGG